MARSRSRQTPADAQRDRTGRRAEVIEVATRLFSERGYRGVSVRDIADAMGINSGGIFYHFASKEELLIEVMRRGLLESHARLVRALDEATTSQQKLWAFVRNHLSTLNEDSPPIALSHYYEWQHFPEGARAELIEHRDAYERVIDSVLKEASEDGCLPEVGGHYRLFLLGALNWTAWWYRPGKAMTLDELTDEFLTFLGSAHAAPPSSEAQLRPASISDTRNT